MKVLGLLVLLSAPAGELLETRARASILDEDPVPVTVSQRLRLTVPTESLLLRALELTGTRIARLEVFDGGRALPAALDVTASPQKRGRVELLEPRSGEIELEIRYEVAGATHLANDAVTARVPLVSVDLPQSRARADAFEGQISLPPGNALDESFPAGLALDGEGRYTGRLPLPPAFMTVRAGPAGALMSVERTLDAGALVLLAGLALLGARRGLRSPR